MSTFAFYNYQFAKIVKHAPQSNLFEGDAKAADPEESFRRKQEILDEILMDDYHGRVAVTFSNARNDKQYRHHYLAPSLDGVWVMKIQNHRIVTSETIDFREEQREEFPACIVVIDNRPGVQRIVIEKRGKAFNSVKQVQNILQSTLCRLLKNYRLTVTLDQLHTGAAYWEVALDRRQYPEGFKRVRFFLPPINLERVENEVKKVFEDYRRSYQSNMAVEMGADDSGRVNIDPNDPLQAKTIEVLTEQVGGNNTITLYPNGKGMKPVHVGKKNFRVADMDEKEFDRLENGDENERQNAVDHVKLFTKRFIND